MENMDNKIENGNALATVERHPHHALLRPIVSPIELMEVQKELHQLIARALEDGRDFGIIPGTKKPTLLKPGAERLNLAFGVYPRYSVVECEVDHCREITWKKRLWKWGEKRGEKIWTEESGMSLGLYRYVVRCELIRREAGEIIGDGIGSASTMESKYIDRPRDLENTVIKMAQKRAFVAATLNAYALSDRFTQDVEDLEYTDMTSKTASPAPPVPTPSDQQSTKEDIDSLKDLACNLDDLLLTLKDNGYMLTEKETKRLDGVHTAEQYKRAIEYFTGKLPKSKPEQPKNGM